MGSMDTYVFAPYCFSASENFFIAPLSACVFFGCIGRSWAVFVFLCVAWAMVVVVVVRIPAGEGRGGWAGAGAGAGAGGRGFEG